MNPKLNTFFLDPKSGQYSTSRLGLMMMILTDMIWVFSFLFNINHCPQYAVGPVCILLGAATGSVAGVYWGSTYTSGGGWMMDINSMAASIPQVVEGIQRAKTKRSRQDGI